MKKTINEDDFSTIFAEVISDMFDDEEMKEHGLPIIMLGGIISF